MTFLLDPRLAADTLPLGDLDLSHLLLMNDARYPWLVLVPRRPGCVEIDDLDAPDRHRLIDEVARCSLALRRAGLARKLNVGALGNRVPQLHVHVVARHEDDAAWPEPIWGRGARVPYEAEAARQRVTAISAALALL